MADIEWSLCTYVRVAIIAKSYYNSLASYLMGDVFPFVDIFSKICLSRCLKFLFLEPTSAGVFSSRSSLLLLLPLSLVGVDRRYICVDIDRGKNGIGNGDVDGSI